MLREDESDYSQTEYVTDLKKPQETAKRLPYTNTSI